MKEKTPSLLWDLEEIGTAQALALGYFNDYIKAVEDRDEPLAEVKAKRLRKKLLEINEHSKNARIKLQSLRNDSPKNSVL